MRATSHAVLLSLACAACGGAPPPDIRSTQSVEPATGRVEAPALREEPIPSQPPVRAEAEDEGALLSELSTGVWGWPEGPNTCQSNPHSISFSDDRSVMRITRAQPLPGGDERTTVYDIEYIGNTVVRGRIPGEMRRTPAGKPVVWDLQLLARGAYCWHRTDWNPGDCTATIRRCPGIDRLPDAAP